MKKYKVLIKETLQKEIQVEAGSKKEALEKAERMYSKSEVVLYADDHVMTEISIKNKSKTREER